MDYDIESVILVLAKWWKNSGLIISSSAEFKELYGEDVSKENYVNTLDINFFGREADVEDLNYCLDQLINGGETLYEVLLGFAESSENKGLFWNNWFSINQLTPLLLLWNHLTFLNYTMIR